MSILWALASLPSLAFVLLMLYAVVDAENIEKATKEAWSHERDA